MTSCVYLSLSFVDQYNVMGKNIFFLEIFFPRRFKFFFKARSGKKHMDLEFYRSSQKRRICASLLGRL